MILLQRNPCLHCSYHWPGSFSATFARRMEDESISMFGLKEGLHRAIGFENHGISNWKSRLVEIHVKDFFKLFLDSDYVQFASISGRSHALWNLCFVCGQDLRMAEHFTFCQRCIVHHSLSKSQTAVNIRHGWKLDMNSCARPFSTW